MTFSFIDSERNEERHTPVTPVKDSAKDSNISDDEGYVSVSRLLC